MSINKETELTEPLNASFPQETGGHPIEHTGEFGIGPKKLATFCDIDGSHKIVEGQDMIKSAKLFLDNGGYDALAEMIKTDYASGIDVSSIA